MSRNNIIIVAGGKGLRMGGELPKQFMLVGGTPILMRSIQAFYDYENSIDIILVLPTSHQEYWQQLCKQYSFCIPHRIATGGDTRFHSVKSGLALADGDIIGVHDGARPFVSKNLIARCFDKLIDSSTAIPVINSTDSLREMANDGSSKIIDRSKIRLVQTPQVFCADVLKRAYETEYADTFTDDASVVEAMGVSIALVEGEVTNIKVTTPLDLKMGELIVNDRCI